MKIPRNQTASSYNLTIQNPNTPPRTVGNDNAANPRLILRRSPKSAVTTHHYIYMFEVKQWWDYPNAD